MRFFQSRVTLALLLLALVMVPLAAQTNNTITVSGSGIAAEAFNALLTQSGLDAANFTVTVKGSEAGISDFCLGAADIALTTQAMSAAEEQNCRNNNIQFSELLLGYDSLVFVTGAENTYLSCLTTDHLNTLFAPSATGETVTWDQINPEYPADAISLIVPSQTTRTFGRLDLLVNGEGVRRDAQIVTDEATVLNAVTATSVGVLRLATLQALNPTNIKPIEIQNDQLGVCVAPTIETLGNRSYPFTDRLLMYVKIGSLNKPDLRPFLDFTVGESAAGVITASGFSAPTAANYTQMQAAVQASDFGRIFTRDVTSFQIPPGISGAVSLSGVTSTLELFSGLVTNLQTEYPSLTLTTTFAGEPAGMRRFCNGEVEIAVIYGEPTDEQRTNCNANNIATQTVELGKQAVLLVSNSASPYLACLKTDQVLNIFKAQATLPANWTQVDPAYPDGEMILFTPSLGGWITDLLLNDPVTGIPLPLRSDTEQNDDPLYRAAAVGNVPAGLTYLTWQDYQDVLANNQQNIQLVGIDNGNGCVTPSLETLNDGTYPLMRTVNLVVSRLNISNPAVQAVLWTIFADRNLETLQNAGFAGYTLDELINKRDRVQMLFNSASAAAIFAPPIIIDPSDAPVIVPDGAVTPEVTPEATAEMTPEATLETTLEVTLEATAESTPETTPQVTP